MKKSNSMIIIGGGSAGLFLALKRAEQNARTGKEEEITIIEDHKRLGLPVQCTGILTDDVYSLITKKEANKFIQNRIYRTRIFSPNNQVDLKINENPIIDNVKFIEFLAEKAEKKGIKILTEHRYLSNSAHEIKIKNIQTQKIITLHANTLIGADGPQSRVAFNNNLYGKRKFLLGIQAKIKIKEAQETIDFYPYVGEYAWAVPESDNILRVGVAIPLEKEGMKNKLFQDFLKKYPGTKLEIQGGLIPLHSPRSKISLVKKYFSVALVGDSALQIKNTTGGGIIPGMKAALELSEGIDTYNKNLKKLNRELYLHYLLHKALSKYKDKDWDRLIRKVKNEKVKRVLEETNRDNAVKMILSLATKPGMLTEGLRAARKIV